MEKNRKILVAILALLALSAILAVFDISMNIQSTKPAVYRLSTPLLGNGIGIVRINGPISLSGTMDGLVSYGASAETILKRLDDLANDSRIKAIVVRINSPGGTVAATQEIFQKIMAIRRKNIKVVASMGDIAASGGYYIAAACEHIVANPGTVTGSIGVIAVSPNLQGLFEKLGIKMNVIKSGVYKDILASYRNLTEEERSLLQTMIDTSYNQFLRDVSLGRNIPIDEIRQFADGRIMSGTQAVEAKLVNETGNFETALQKARQLAHLPDDCPVFDEEINPLEQFLSALMSVFLRRGSIEQKLYERFENSAMLEYRYRP